MTAGRVFLAEIDRLAAAGASFAFETTFSGRAYATRLARWKLAGYRTEIVYLMIDSPQIALKRIASRVKEGGHGIPRDVVLRRFGRSWTNFVRIYRPMANAWSVYDNSGAEPQLLEQGP